jgi:hypothetical protein
METLEKNVNKLANLIKSLPISDKIAVFNNACEEWNWRDNYIYSNDDSTIDEILIGKTPYEIIQLIDSDYNINDDWFFFDDYGFLSSFKDHEFDKTLDGAISDIAREAIRSHVDYDNKKIKKFLDSI